MPWSRSTRLLGLVLFIVAVRAASAQDANHWTDQFGNRARLLSGAVVGSAGDLSAVYYNPGALAKADRPEIAVSADAIEYTTATLHGGITPDQSVSSTRFIWLPSFFGGYVHFDQLGNSRLAYCFLSRTDLETRLEEHVTIPGPAISPGLDSSALSMGLHQRITEYWFGVTWSRAVGDRLGLGLSNFVVVRDQRSGVEAVLQGAGTGAASALSIVGRGFDYEHWRLVWKFGASVPLESWSFGVSLTTPGVGIAGSGQAAANRSYFFACAVEVVSGAQGAMAGSWTFAGILARASCRPSAPIPTVVTMVTCRSPGRGSAPASTAVSRHPA